MLLTDNPAGGLETPPKIVLPPGGAGGSTYSVVCWARAWSLSTLPIASRVRPTTRPRLAYGLARAAYIGAEAAAALTMHLTKIAAYGAGDLLTGKVLLYGAVLISATLAGAWTG